MFEPAAIADSIERFIGTLLQQNTTMASEPIQRRKLCQQVLDRLLARVRGGEIPAAEHLLRPDLVSFEILQEVRVFPKAGMHMRRRCLDEPLRSARVALAQPGTDAAPAGTVLRTGRGFSDHGTMGALKGADPGAHSAAGNFVRSPRRIVVWPTIVLLRVRI